MCCSGAGALSSVRLAPCRDVSPTFLSGLCLRLHLSGLCLSRGWPSPCMCRPLRARVGTSYRRVLSRRHVVSSRSHLICRSHRSRTPGRTHMGQRRQRWLCLSNAWAGTHRLRAGSVHSKLTHAASHDHALSMRQQLSSSHASSCLEKGVGWRKERREDGATVRPTRTQPPFPSTQNPSVGLWPSARHPHPCRLPEMNPHAPSPCSNI